MARVADFLSISFKYMIFQINYIVFGDLCGVGIAAVPGTGATPGGAVVTTARGAGTGWQGLRGGGSGGIWIFLAR